MEFIIEQICKSTPGLVVELGTASGVSSAAIIYASMLLKETSKISESVLYSFDISDKCYWDKTLKVGYAVKEILDINLESGWNLIHKSSVIDFKKYFSRNSIDFLFIDANHRHPYPALDLLFAHPYLKPNALVCLHDINLPSLLPDAPFGPNYLFFQTDLKREIDKSSEIPNIGLLKIESTEDQVLKQTLLDVIFNNKWEAKLMDSYMNRLEEEILKLYLC